MKYSILYILLLTALPGIAQNHQRKEIKNVILLIPDGTSTDLIALSRWFNNNQALAVDEIICGMVKTHSIDDRFPDSAPTSTAYATGIKSVSGFVGVDSASVPHLSVMELAGLKGLSTGIVVTCEYPHATPAGFVCHYPDRKNYAVLTRQFLNNSPNIVFAGGKGILDTINRGKSLMFFKDSTYKLIAKKDQFEELQYNNDSIVWALFPDWHNATEYKSYQCDIREHGDEPSLSEMTWKAIDILKHDEEGFFLMVEGSQIDWACHNNDPFAAVTEFLEFDKAVGVALDFARKDLSTLVIVVPDHGNGGLTIGNTRSNVAFITKNTEQYDKINIRERVIEPLKKVKCSGRKLAEMILADSNYANADTISYYFNISDPAVAKKINDIKKAFPESKLTDTIQYILGSAYSAENFIGWTTTGHTAEDVFLAVYVPEGGERITGVIDNTIIADYIARQLRLGCLGDSTDKYFCRSDLLFIDDPDVIATATPDSLVIQNNFTQLVIYANTRRIKVKYSGLPETNEWLPTIAVCIQDSSKKYLYYLPKTVYGYLK